jgi:hypothetical protein
VATVAFLVELLAWLLWVALAEAEACGKFAGLSAAFWLEVAASGIWGWPLVIPPSPHISSLDNLDLPEKKPCECTRQSNAGILK